MDKKTYLSTKTTIYFYILLLFNLLFLLYFLLRPLSPSYNESKDRVLFIIMILGNCILGGVYYFSVIRPYHRIKIMYLLFSKGTVYEELFSPEYMISQEQEMVMSRFHHLLNKQDAINISKKQAEYLALQNQINPHFLYNTLEAIRGDALSVGLDSIAKTTEALASFFRYTITDVGNLVSLEDAVENSQNYFIIQQYRFGDKLDMQIHYPENEDSILHLQVPKLTLQPIIENAIFHGLEQISDKGTIHISFETTETRLFIDISDNGIGIEPDVLSKLNEGFGKSGISYVKASSKKSGGIALLNVARRIRLLFGDEYGLHIYSTPGLGTTVHITLPKLTALEADALNREDSFIDETRDI